MKHVTALLVAGALATSALAQVSGDGSASIATQQASADDLLQALESGGHAIYFRHANTVGAQKPREVDSGMQRASLADPALLRYCAIQRNLDDMGRADALRIGAVVEARGIPIGAVLSSPFCRTVDHALLSFGRVEITSDVHYAGTFPIGTPEREALADGLQALLSRAVTGGNIVIVAHGNNFDDVTGILMEEGEAAVIRPLGDGFEIVGRLSPEDWRSEEGE